MKKGEGFKMFAALIVIFQLMLGCSGSKHGSPASVQSESPKLIFMSFKIRPDTVIKLSSKVVEGKISKEEQEVFSTQLPVLTYRLLDAGMQVLEEKTIPHPLYESLEYENESHELARKEIVHSEADFFIRVSYNSRMKYIRFSESIQGKVKALQILNL